VRRSPATGQRMQLRSRHRTHQRQVRRHELVEAVGERIDVGIPAEEPGPRRPSIELEQVGERDGPGRRVALLVDAEQLAELPGRDPRGADIRIPTPLRELARFLSKI